MTSANGTSSKTQCSLCLHEKGARSPASETGGGGWGRVAALGSSSAEKTLAQTLQCGKCRVQPDVCTGDRRKPARAGLKLRQLLRWLEESQPPRSSPDSPLSPTSPDKWCPFIKYQVMIKNTCEGMIFRNVTDVCVCVCVCVRLQCRSCE